MAPNVVQLDFVEAHVFVQVRDERRSFRAGHVHYAVFHGSRISYIIPEFRVFLKSCPYGFRLGPRIRFQSFRPGRVEGVRFFDPVAVHHASNLRQGSAERMPGHPDLLPGREFGKYPVHELHEVPGLVCRNPADGEPEVRSEVSEIRKFRSAYGDRYPSLLVLHGHRREPRRSGFAVLLVGEPVDHREPLRLHLVEEFGTLFGLVFPYVFQSGLQTERPELFVLRQRLLSRKRLRNVRLGLSENALQVSVARDEDGFSSGDGLDFREGFRNPFRSAFFPVPREHFRLRSRRVEPSGGGDVQDVGRILRHGIFPERSESGAETFQRRRVEIGNENLFVFRQFRLRGAFDIPRVREGQRVERGPFDFEASWNSFRVGSEVDVREVGEIAVFGDLRSVGRGFGSAALWDFVPNVPDLGHRRFGERGFEQPRPGLGVPFFDFRVPFTHRLRVRRFPPFRFDHLRRRKPRFPFRGERGYLRGGFERSGFCHWGKEVGRIRNRVPLVSRGGKERTYLRLSIGIGLL